MGSKVTRLIRNFNVENRAHREISRAKPRAAPRHLPDGGIPHDRHDAPSITEDVHRRNDPLLSMLKDVYVESKDPVAQGDAVVQTLEQETQRRQLKLSLPGEPYGFCDVSDVPKGKLSLVEAITALNNHKNLPETWTAEKLAQEYALDPKDAKALTDFFFPFDVRVISKKPEETKQITED
uniref:NADH dehydrogenase [ubiquinone] 1 alpha subcomplex assembly factor 4 n=1 Tax=Danio rerio TaxID=7955 RepID=UPI003D9F2733